MQIVAQSPQKTPLAPIGAFTLLSVASLTIMVGCAIVPALPSIAPALGVPHASSWLVTLPSLGVVLLAPIAGRTIDKIGNRRALCLGLALYGLLGLGALATHGLVAVFADRIFLGGATALVMSAGTGLISEFYAGSARMHMIARQGMAIELGGIIFLFVGGLLAKLGWAGPFSLYAIAFVFLLMVLAFVPSEQQSERPERESLSTTTKNGIRIVYAAALLSMTVFFTAVIVLPFRLAVFVPHHFTESEVGYFLAFVSLVAVGAAFTMPRLVRRLGELRTLAVAFCAYALAHTCFTFALSLPLLILGAVCLGCGFGFSIPLVNHMTVERSSSAQRGKALAYLSMAIFVGQFMSSFMDFMPGGYVAIFRTAAIAAICTAIAYGLLLRGQVQPNELQSD
ncbi:MFS transporter [Acetobacter sp.]|uniref:MFS transporter n=1 Tax=Acetobacter sp. TaxID=440 RepID=UPI0039EA2A05